MLRKTAIGLAAATIAIGGLTLSVSAQDYDPWKPLPRLPNGLWGPRPMPGFAAAGRAFSGEHGTTSRAASPTGGKQYGKGSGGAGQYGAASSGRGVTRSTRPHR
jgi:hypothetical protein